MSNIKTFGDDLNPACNTIEIEPGDKIRCPCGKFEFDTGGWVSAHWNERLRATCSCCNQIVYLNAGRATLKGNGRWHPDHPKHDKFKQA